MADAPERIWAKCVWGELFRRVFAYLDDRYDGLTPYVRANLHDAALAELAHLRLALAAQTAETERVIAAMPSAAPP